MRYFVLTGFRHGATSPVLIAIPEGHAAVADFKDLVRAGTHEEFREIHLVSSTSGVVMKRKLKDPNAQTAVEEPALVEEPAPAEPAPVVEAAPPEEPKSVKQRRAK